MNKDELARSYFENIDKDTLRGRVILGQSLSKHPSFNDFVISLGSGVLGRLLINFGNQANFEEIVGKSVYFEDQVFQIDAINSIYEEHMRAFYRDEISRGGKYRVTLVLYSVTNLKREKTSEDIDFEIAYDSFLDTDIVTKLLNLPPHFGSLMENNSFLNRARFQKDGLAKDLMGELIEMSESSIEEFDKILIDFELSDE